MHIALDDIKNIATIFSVLIASGSLAYSASNLLLQTRTNRAKFWLDLRSAFEKHEVHRKLRPGGEWDNNAGPNTPDDYALVEAYMGLFEHCEVMLSERLIDERTFRDIYRYRLENLIHNDWVRVEKVCRRGDRWKNFIALLNRMHVKYNC